MTTEADERTMQYLADYVGSQPVMVANVRALIERQAAEIVALQQDGPTLVRKDGTHCTMRQRFTEILAELKHLRAAREWCASEHLLDAAPAETAK